VAYSLLRISLLAYGYWPGCCSISA